MKNACAGREAARKIRSLPYERLLEEIASNYLTDTDFAKFLDTDARAAIGQLLGHELAEGIEIVVHRNVIAVTNGNVSGKLHVVVPVDPTKINATDRDLVPYCMRFRAADHLCDGDVDRSVRAVDQQTTSMIAQAFSLDLATGSHPALIPGSEGLSTSDVDTSIRPIDQSTISKILSAYPDLKALPSN